MENSTAKKKKQGTAENNVDTTSTSASIINKQSTGIRSVAKIISGVAIATSLLVFIGIKRYINQGGPFTPWTCCVFGYECEQNYNIPFRGYVYNDYVAAEQAFKENFYAGEEVGASAFPYLNGKLVLDIQGGWQNGEEQAPYTGNTLQMVFSSSKVLVILLCVCFFPVYVHVYFWLHKSMLTVLENNVINN